MYPPQDQKLTLLIQFWQTALDGDLDATEFDVLAVT